ncbi:DUF6036 family nucleotidyltransferase [Jatrophihabitans sp. YIM 134969]
MTREELAHILRASATIADDPDILVIGSQSILGSFDEHELPDAAVASAEADIAFLNDPTLSKSDKVDLFIGEDSSFHESFAIYGQGVDLTTATLPEGWQERLVNFELASAEPSRARCLEPHDLVVSKLVAGRAKDLTFAWALIEAGLVSTTTLEARAKTLDAGLARDRALETIRNYAGKIKPPRVNP